MLEFLQNNVFLTSMFVATFMVILTVWLHFEILQLGERMIPKIHFFSGRMRITALVFIAFFAHTLEVWAYAVCYYVMVDLGLGSLGGQFDHTMVEYVYYSMVSYTSLGLGDVFPSGALRLLTGIEALNGLVLIAWTASYTYLYMTKFWKFRTDNHK